MFRLAVLILASNIIFLSKVANLHDNSTVQLNPDLPHPYLPQTSIYRGNCLSPVLSFY